MKIVDLFLPSWSETRNQQYRFPVDHKEVLNVKDNWV